MSLQTKGVRVAHVQSCGEQQEPVTLCHVPVTLTHQQRNGGSKIQHCGEATEQVTNFGADVMQERGEPPPKPFPTHYDIISSDEEATLRTIVQITTGITSVADPVQASLEHFEKR